MAANASNAGTRPPRRAVGGLGGSLPRINPSLLRSVAVWAERIAFALVGWATLRIEDLPFDPLLAPICAFAGTTILILFILMTRLREAELHRFIDQSLSVRLKKIVFATLLPFLLTLAITLAVFPAGARGFSTALVRWQWIWGLCALGSMTIGRLTLAVLLRRWRSQGRLTLRIAIVGYGVLAERLIQWLNEFCAGLIEFVGIFDDRSRSRLLESGLQQLLSGTVDDLIELAKNCEIDRVIVALPHSADQRVLVILRKLKQIPIDISLAPDMAGFAAAAGRTGEFAGLPLINVYGPPLQAPQRLIKGCIDRVVAALALAALSSAFLLIAIMVKLDSKGPVFFRQRRYGLGGRIINVFKFRTMQAQRVDQDARLQQTKRSDQRVTRVGRLLRRTSLDELPQLLNVLRGDMSLVGPRPLAVQMQVEERLNHEIVSDYALRHRVKPGITGWAQVNGYRGAVDSAEALCARVAYDLSYIENWSLWFDLRIVLMTTRALVAGENAF
jgi:Undecaprenyl-phosphate glucose phosphotransferase